jgi:hypothetical protein
MRAAWELMAVLLNMASEGNPTLAASVKQQLQQSGMLQPLAAAMAAMAADLQAEAASIAAAKWDAADANIDQVVSATPHPHLLKVLCVQGQLVGLWVSQTPLASAGAVSWVCDPSGHLAAGIQLITATVQHVSSVVQHVLPALRQQSPQQADEHLARLSAELRRMHSPAISMVGLLSDAVRLCQQGDAAYSSLQQVLLSPHMLPYLVLVLTGHTASVRRALTAGSDGVGNSSRDSTGRSQRQQQGGTGVGSSRGGNSEAAGEVPVMTGCQLQLLQQLGLAPEPVSWLGPPSSMAPAANSFRAALHVCTGCHNAVQRLQLLQDRATGATARWPEEQQQQWAAEHKLWLLLPTVLVPCAYDLLLPSAQVMWQHEQFGVARSALLLVEVSRGALHGSALLCRRLGIPVVRPDGWAQELLGGLMLLAGRLGEQPLAPGPAVPTPGSTGSSSSSGSSSGGSSIASMLTACAEHVLFLLTAVSREGTTQYERHSVSSSAHGDSSDSATGSVPPVATSFVQFSGACEAALRTITAGVQGGAARGDKVHAGVSGRCAELLLQHRGQCAELLVQQTSHITNSLIMQYMGLCGPSALAQEQRQLYSLLSTVLKLGRCESLVLKLECCESLKGQLWCWRAAASCSLAAAQAAVNLLPLVATAGPGQPAPEAAAQQSAVDYLPSLVIFGRCCLQWADQLQQQSPGLVLWAAATASGPLQHEQEWRDALLYEHSVANVSIPGLRDEAATLPGEKLESLVAVVSGWVGGLGSAGCVEQLAAAGCSPQQLQQQLDALLAAQQATQQGLTDASLAVLVQQLQATGRVFCSIAVPHFCNNVACGNISGPTEVRLVSGRSCLCAGCLTARYCGRDCQRAAWKQHKPVCKALAAAAAAAAVVS